ncbi:radical SAM protein [Clostridia bacterium OttesenSCG-928-F22]|nr:radical SAM protein [Clostridia bacterium OttesenSCG-928-F22]
MEYISAKTILSKQKKPEYWFGVEYNMNLYRGCNGGCIYCDSRSDCYRVERFDEVRAKGNALAVLERELTSKKKQHIVGMGAMSDPYNPYEKELKLTRGALELLCRQRFGATVTTKNALVTRDIDVLQQLNLYAPLCVKLTITTLDDALAKKIEPYSSSTQERFLAIEKLRVAGVYTGILLMPVLPFINDTVENIAGIVRQAGACGASFIYPMFGVTLRDNQQAYYYQKLDELFPGVKQQYFHHYSQQQYEYRSPNASKCWAVFQEECERHGILYRMKDIIAAYQVPMQEGQLNFFE